MKAASVLMLCLVLTACAGLDRLAWEEEGGHYMLLETATLPKPFTLFPTATRVRHCTGVTEKVDTFKNLIYSGCTTSAPWQVVLSNGYVAQVVTPLIYGGAAIVAADILSDGIAASGSTTIQNGGGANATGGNANATGGNARASNLTNIHTGKKKH